MRKFFVGTMLAVSLFVVTGCATSKTQTSTEETKTAEKSELKATITLIQEEKEIASKEVTFKEDENLLEVLKANFEVADDKGMITEIAGVKQDAEKGCYWMYKINDKMAELGAGETILKNGDKVVFTYAKI
ncbi:protein of unknown function [Pilibacter termitis]|uniref:Transcobalamin-like C-terminal domain-containing protein n=1 Tax=Pilibacter termitis TaxID=263852 RepID=A0A1T4MJ91_9ENTE|nr:DUF4430 domain-containing protein [Pilibacter termitis]SJZ67042.1 protein of unknown function [Pilibacter termitis]